MKIIIPNLPIPSLRYIAQCLESIQNEKVESLLWNTNQTSIIDMFDEAHPDIIFLHTSQLDSSFNLICQEFSFKYVLLTEDTIPTNLSQSPNAIINLSNSSNIDPHNKNVVQFQPMANIPDLHNAQYIDKFKSTIIVDTTFATLNNDVMGLITYIISKYPTKIIGHQKPLLLPHYIGTVSMAERANFFKSAKIVLDIGNVGDCWDAAYLQVPSLSISPTHSVIFHCKNLSFLEMHLNTLLNKDLVRQKYITAAYEDACKTTSFHFSAHLFNKIGELQLSQMLLNDLKRFI